MSNVEVVEWELSQLPEHLRRTGLASGALTMAGLLDDPGNSATSKSMCCKSMLDALKELRELAPPVQQKDGLDDLKARRAARLAGRADSSA